jgi:hypothetical protein
MEQKYGSERGECSNGLQRKHDDRRSWPLRKRGDGEERHDGELPGHKQLPEMRFGALVRLSRDPRYGDMTQDDGQGCSSRSPRRLIRGRSRPCSRDQRPCLHL